MYRRQIEYIIKDIDKKIVFIVGPRQVGKTWLAKEIAGKFKNPVYLNYDNFDDKKIIDDMAWIDSTDLLILDELHKKTDWKNFLKGMYDTKNENLKIIVTGSARLDTFRKSGDSMAGRFFSHVLLPFSLSELKGVDQNFSIDRLVERGGFPEPFLSEEDITHKRWRNQYIDGFIRNDILYFENIHNLKHMELLVEMLRRRVGSPVSFKSIAEDLKIAPNTVMKYVSILESLYIIFRVSPFSKNIARSILKEPKLYFFDNGLVIGDEGVRFENFAAISLFKHVSGRNDILGDKMTLNYLRTKDGKEVDFCISDENEVLEAIEVKNSRKEISDNLRYFCDKYSFKGIQVVRHLKNERKDGNIEVRNGVKFFSELFI
jgi:predicted AAA+ superfamily ATPase